LAAAAAADHLSQPQSRNQFTLAAAHLHARLPDPNWSSSLWPKIISQYDIISGNHNAPFGWQANGNDVAPIQPAQQERGEREFCAKLADDKLAHCSARAAKLLVPFD